MTTNTRDVRLAGSTLHHACHACALFRDLEEEYSVLMPFAREGYERGEKLFQVVDARHRPERLRRLADAGMAADEADPTAQVEVRPWEAAYLRGGRFNQDAMLELIQEALRDGKARGYALTRLWANMEWALEELPGVEDLLEYETRLNHILPQYDDIVVCTYDLSKFSAGVVVDILRTHPWAVVGRTLQQNPFYIPPDQMLREMRGRT
jgi:hypothetical protein